MLAGTTLLDLHVFGHSVGENEPTPMDGLVAMSKLSNEPPLTEVLEGFG